MLSNNPPLPDRLALDHAKLGEEIEALASRANDAPRQIKDTSDLDTVAVLVRDASTLKRRVDVVRADEKAPYLEGGRTVDAFFKVFIDRVERIQFTFQRVADDHTRAVAAERRRAAEEEARRAREEEERQREIAARAEAANRLKAAGNAEARAERAIDRADVAERAAAAPAAEIVGKTVTASGISAGATETWTFEITDYAALPLDALRPYLKREAVEAALRAFVKFNKDTTPLTGVRIFADIKARIR